MRVIPGILMLLVVSGVTGSASAAKFDLNSALVSVLQVVLDTKQFENKVSYGDYVDVEEPSYGGDDEVDREIPLDSEGRPLYDSDIYEHDRRTRERTEENRRRAEATAVYTCDLDNPGYNIVTEAPAIDAYDEVSVESEYYSGSEYYSDKYYDDKSKCEQRHAIIYNETQEKNRKQQAERTAAFNKLPEPKIGMTKDQVRKSRWGNPIIIELETDAQGKYEKWHYSHTQVLHFKNGKVTRIINAKGGS